jgi:Tol biopolymer transport system component
METNNFRFYEFGEFKLDSGHRILTKKDGEISISAKNFDILLALIQNEGRIMSHDQLLNLVWGDTFVGQSNLKKGISSRRSGADEIWQADINGGNLRQLTDEKIFVANPKFSPDGRIILFEKYQDAFYQIVEMPVEGGAAKTVFNAKSNNFDFSPDSKMLALGMFDETDKRWKIALLNSLDYSLIKVFDDSPNTFLTFTPDSKNLVYNVSDTAHDGGNVWIQPLEGGSAKSFIELKNEKIFCHDFSTDGKKIYYTRGRTNSNVVLLKLETEK